MKPTKEDIAYIAGLVAMCQQINNKMSNLDFDMIINIDLNGVHITWKTFNRLYGDEPFQIENRTTSGGDIFQVHSIMHGNVKVFALYDKENEGWVEL